MQMEGLSGYLKMIGEQQTSYTQVIMSSDQFGQLGVRVAELESHLKNRDLSVKEMKAEIQQKNRLLKDMERDVAETKENLEFWKENMMQSLGVLRRSVRDESTISANWASQLQRERETVAFLESKVQEQSTKTASYAAEVSVLQSNLTKVTEERNIAVENFKRLQEVKEKLYEKNSMLKQEATSAVESKKELVEELMELKSLLNNASVESKSKSIEIKDLKETTIRLKDQLNSLEAQGKKSTKTEDKLKKELTDLKSEVYKLKEDLKSKENEITSLEKQNKSLTKNSNKLDVEPVVDKKIDSILKVVKNGINGNKQASDIAEFIGVNLSELPARLPPYIKLAQEYKKKSNLNQIEPSINPSSYKSDIEQSEHESKSLKTAKLSKKTKKNNRNASVDSRDSGLEVNQPRVSPPRNRVSRDKIEQIGDTDYKHLFFCKHETYVPSCEYCIALKASKEGTKPPTKIKSKENRKRR